VQEFCRHAALGTVGKADDLDCEARVKSTSRVFHTSSLHQVKVPRKFGQPSSNGFHHFSRLRLAAAVHHTIIRVHPKARSMRASSG